MNQDYRSFLYESYVDQFELDKGASAKALEEQRPVYRKLLKRFLPTDKNASILDAGCGHGELVYFLKEEGYRKVVGVDVSHQQVLLAGRLGIENIEERDLFSFLRDHPSQFELITAFDVMEHLKKEEVIDFLKAAFSALKPGGKLVVRVPNATSPLSGNYRYGDFTHELSFTRSSIKQVFSAFGFLDVQVFSVAPVSHGIISTSRFLLWRIIELLVRFYLMVETGEFRDQILTQNLIAVGTAPLNAPV